MKKLNVLISFVVFLTGISTTFASIKIAPSSQQSIKQSYKTHKQTGIDYVGNIVAAQFQPYTSQQIMIITAGDNKDNESGIEGVSIIFDENDYALGLTLAGSVGKKVAMTFDETGSDITYLTIITDEYWNGSKKR